MYNVPDIYTANNKNIDTIAQIRRLIGEFVVPRLDKQDFLWRGSFQNHSRGNM